MLTLSRKVGPYELSMQFKAEELSAGVRVIEETAKSLYDILNDPTYAPSTFTEIPTLGASGTYTDKITKLFESEWGIRPRTIREIKQALEANHSFLPMTTLSSVLYNMVTSGKLKRWKEEKVFVYHRGRVA